ncbi:MAG: beta-lactamase family protein [Candidatus Eremiobacteraeota bacterium]|nr:beta-lactamase family protein [Candidatus Eremiobacteraeota bacterium]
MMKRSAARRRIGTLAFAAMLGLAGCGGGGAGSSLPSSTPTTSPSSPVDAVVSQAYAGNWGVELAIYKNGRALYQRGYGLRDRGLPDSFGGHDFWGVVQPDRLFALTRGVFAPDANTIFDLASVSKEFTAAAILLLQQDGKLSVNDPLSKYFPAFPNATRMSLLDLLHHSSGLVDYNSFGSYPDFSSAYTAFVANGETSYQPIVDLLGTFPLQFTPGTQYSYSNSNYLLLGLVVAQVSGETLEMFLQHRIFGPAGMIQTHQGFPAPPVTDLALGYADYGSGPQRSYQPNLAWLAGPGGLTSTVGDVEKWDRVVSAPGIFTSATLAQMFAPGPFPQSYGTYADGWFVSSLNGHPFVWHDGAMTGYQTVNARFPSDGIDIIILTNSGSGPDPYYILSQIFPIALTMP